MGQGKVDTEEADVSMKKRRIPALKPNGTRCVKVDTYEVGRRVRKQDGRDRLRGEPWRASGYDAAYRAARQQVIERAGGRCERCGVKVARKSGGRWIAEGGEVHHLIPLSDGGSSSLSNLAFLCIHCHRLLDAARRRGDTP